MKKYLLLSILFSAITSNTIFADQDKFNKCMDAKGSYCHCYCRAFGKNFNKTCLKKCDESCIKNDKCEHKCRIKEVKCEDQCKSIKDRDARSECLNNCPTIDQCMKNDNCPPIDYCE